MTKADKKVVIFFHNMISVNFYPMENDDFFISFAALCALYRNRTGG